MSAPVHDATFRCMGCDVRLLVEPGHRAVDPAGLAGPAEAFLHHADRTLSRFDPESELSRLNADPRERVPASALLRRAVAAGLWAARRTGGLVDPTLLSEIEDAGYTSTLADAAPASLADALRLAPPRRAARAHPDATWRGVAVDHDAQTITRPPGLRLDTGGFGKGLAADLAALMLSEAGRFAVDCAGDIAIGGRDPEACEVEIEHPLTHEIAHTVAVAHGGIATTGLDRHLWTHDDRYAHHLLDPFTGEPAWTGLVGATALGDSALEAETLAKAALLSGPVAGRRFLREHGGVLFCDAGEAIVVEAAPQPLRVSARELLSLTEARSAR